jgi:molybdopterin-guanine dinucleotide biosynthesis protein MobB
VPSVIAVVGDSDTGKTTLLEQLIPALSEEGLAVAAVKHASHGFDADRSGKDSQRLYASGAHAVALISNTQLATFVRREPERRPSLGEALAALPAGLDAVLVEGFAWEPIPRVVLVSRGRTPRDEHLEGGPVLRVIEVPPIRGENKKPALSNVLVRALATEIAHLGRRWERPRTDAPQTTVVPEHAVAARIGRNGSNRRPQAAGKEGSSWKLASKPGSG